MKKLKLKIFLLSLISLLSILSCSVISSSDDDETYFPITQETLGSSFITKTSVVNGKLDFSGAIPNEISLILAQTQNQDARSACPDYDVYSKFVVASTEGQSDIVGVINADNTFSLVLPYGAWTIKAGVKKGDAIICSSEQNITVVSDSITLPSFNMTSMQSASGSVDLEMIIDSSIRSFTATCISPTPSTWDVTSNCSLASGKLTIKTNPLKSGCYIVEFCFYKTSTPTGDLAYSTTQAINVFDNLCTNKWVASAYESNISSDGTFSITAENINNFHLTTLYVDGGTSNAIESGTWLNPCKTVARAVQKCTDSTKTYTISVSGTTKEADSTINLDKNFNFVGMGTSPTIGRASSSSGYLMQVSSGNTVNITGININCSSGSSKMPGIKVFGTLNVTDSTIENCQNSQQGGAINSIGAVKLTNSTIKSCTSTENGGAIYSSGNLTLVNSIIQDNSSDKNGGGIYFDGMSDTNSLSIDADSCIGSESPSISANSSNKSNSARCGGGIYVTKGTLNCSGKINCNYATENGGGIYINSGATATFLNNALLSCNATNSTNGKGGGIYADSTFNLSGSAKIDSNNDIYLNEDVVVKITSDLTQTSVAKITPKSYPADETDVIPVVDSTNATLLSSNYKKFSLSNTNFDIAKNGKIYLYQAVSSVTTPTSGKTYAVATSDDLSALRTLVNDGTDFEGTTIVLLSDIELPSTYTSIGVYSSTAANCKPFKGTFDGKNHTVTFNGTQNGIFACTEDATIKNVKTAGNISSTKEKVGAVVGSMRGGSLTNCSNSANISAYSCTGGIIGNVEIKDNDSDRSILVNNCINTGNINSNSHFVGGIAGSSSSVVFRNCLNFGYIKGAYGIAGICGGSHGRNYGETPKGTLGSLYENCGNNGTIEATNANNTEGAGGIAGANSSGNEEWIPDIKNCWSIGTIKSTNDLKGGIWGKAKNFSYDSVRMEKCVYMNASHSAGKTDPNGASKKSSLADIVTAINNAITNTSIYKRWKVSGSQIVFDE